MEDITLAHLRQLHEAVVDAIHELSEPEVVELTSMALDRKLADARDILKEYIEHAQEA